MTGHPLCRGLRALEGSIFKGFPWLESSLLAEHPWYQSICLQETIPETTDNHPWYPALFLTPATHQAQKAHGPNSPNIHAFARCQAPTTRSDTHSLIAPEPIPQQIYAMRCCGGVQRIALAQCTSILNRRPRGGPGTGHRWKGF